jgi:hypothetical protein
MIKNTSDHNRLEISYNNNKNSGYVFNRNTTIRGPNAKI